MRPQPFKFFLDYLTFGRQTWARMRFRNLQADTPRYRAAVVRYPEAQLLQVHIDHVSNPYYSPELMVLLQQYLPAFVDFRTAYRTYVMQQWNPIFADWDPHPGAVVVVEQPLLQRDRLMQIFDACPVGSYGYYARRGLGPFRAVVGSFAAATIDEFFASQIALLVQPFSQPVNDLMSTMETKYWNSRKELVDWLAGQTFTKRGRELGVTVPSVIYTLWEGERRPELPDGVELNAEQLEVARQILTTELPNLDDAAFAAFADELYPRLVANQKAARE